MQVADKIGNFSVEVLEYELHFAFGNGVVQIRYKMLMPLKTGVQILSFIARLKPSIFGPYGRPKEITRVWEINSN